MLNPEGVLCGNFRCSFTGTDLNRRWDQPDRILHPQIYYLKNLLRKLVAEKKEILVFCDLHGHSKKIGSFIYGCNKAAHGGFCSWTKVRLLPRVMAKRCPLFSYGDCRFRVENDKQRTARVVMWKEFGVTNSFTLESSFYGYMRGDEILPYTPDDYATIGEALLMSMLEYHYLLKEIEKELVITRGWLKPSKLKQLTGTPAADLLARKIAQQKEEAKRKQRVSKIKSVLRAKRDKASIMLFLLIRIGRGETQEEADAAAAGARKSSREIGPGARVPAADQEQAVLEGKTGEHRSSPARTSAQTAADLSAGRIAAGGEHEPDRDQSQPPADCPRTGRRFSCGQRFPVAEWLLLLLHNGGRPEPA